jgi:hypothetical protein
MTFLVAGVESSVGSRGFLGSQSAIVPCGAPSGHPVPDRNWVFEAERWDLLNRIPRFEEQGCRQK